jgi:transposase InsO family protein
MVYLLHANAKTTPRIREEIQNSKESIAKIAKRLNLNEKTVAKWRNAGRVVDKRSGPIEPKSALSTSEQQVICAFRKATKLPLDDVFLTLRDKIPALTRSNLHRCLKRNGLNILPKEELEPREKKAFKDYPPGYVHVDITQVQVEEGKFYLFVAIDRCSKYVYVELHPRMTAEIACNFLQNLVEHCSFKITKLLTDNGAQFTYALLAEHLRPQKCHPFDVVCQQHGIEHRLTKFRHPWTNGQVEITNKILKQHTTKRYHYENIEELKQHLFAFVLYYNHQRPLKALKYKSPYDILIQYYTSNPELFRINPTHKKLGLNSYSMFTLM